MTQPEQIPTAEPAMLSYGKAPHGDIFVSDATLNTLARTRPWALFCAIGMFVYAIPGGVIGVIWMVVAISRRTDPTFKLAQFVIVSTPNLLGAPLALVGGVLAIRYFNAVGRAFTWRNTDDLERVVKRLRHIWCWAGVTVLALLAMPFIVLFTGWALGVG